MALASQKSRSEWNPRDMTSKRRNFLTRPWFLLAVLTLFALVGIVIWTTRPGELPPTAMRTDEPPQPTAPPTLAPTPKLLVDPSPLTQITPTPARTTPQQPLSATTVAKPLNQSNSNTHPPTGPTPLQAPANSSNTHNPAASAPTLPSGPSALTTGLDLLNQGKLVEGRQALSQLLINNASTLSPTDAQLIRQKLTEANNTLVFSSRVVPGDTFAETYTIQSGDLLARIAPRFKTTYQLIETVNSIDSRRIRVGQKIKIVHGPFQAVVSKSSFRLDIFLGDPANPISCVYIRSFQVGLGEDNSTPLGSWVVRKGGKLANPAWTNPRTSQFFSSDNPDNPIGEFWIGLEGADNNTRGLAGYGIHGTLDLTSIGRTASMGCVRMRPEDIEMAYKLLTESHSTVTIAP
jgi:lipoprotein-anchoring transpeptidase ErfK/SrfK